VIKKKKKKKKKKHLKKAQTVCFLIDVCFRVFGLKIRFPIPTIYNTSQELIIPSIARERF